MNKFWFDRLSAVEQRIGLGLSAAHGQVPVCKQVISKLYTEGPLPDRKAGKVPSTAKLS